MGNSVKFGILILEAALSVYISYRITRWAVRDEMKRLEAEKKEASSIHQPWSASRVRAGA